MDELTDRLRAVITILEEMDNAATPDLVEAMNVAIDIITEKRQKNQSKQARIKEQQLERDRKKLNEELVKFSSAFDDVFEQFLLQLFKHTNNKDDKRFKE